MRDPHQLAIMRILTEMESAAYMSSPKLFALINFKQVYLSVKYGNESISAYVYAVYGLLLCGVLNDIKTGVRFGQLALKLLEQPAAEKHKAKTLVVVNNFIAHWQRHAKANLEPLLEAYQIGLETGDLEYAALAAFLYPTTAFIIGKPLSQVNQDMLKFEQTIAKLNQKTAWQFIQLWRQVVLNLQIPSPERLQGESYDEEKKLAFYLQTNDKTTLCFIYVNKLIFCYLFEQYQSALDCASALDNYSEGILSLILVPIFYFYDSLTRLAIYPHISKAQQKQFLKQVTNNQKKMNHWAKHAPMNYHHKYLLVEAEKARVLGHHWKAVEHYDLAIQHAKEQGYQQEEALANELAAKFWLAQRKEEFARTYMQKARINYQQWGALHKVEALEDNYPDLCTELATETITPSSKLKASTKPTDTFTASPEDTITTSSITFAAQGYLDMLDLTTVTKASQALASEIVLEKLLATLMAILIENAGAQKGFLLLPEEDELKIEAVGEVNKTEVLVLQSLPIEKHLPTSIINYVARTRKPLLLANAKREGLYTNDNYIKAHQTKSILCTPILYQNQLVGLIYLENNLMPHAFTPDRLRILTLLSTQMAISLANARFVAKLEQARQAAEAANYAKTAFLANVSHELHTPLNGILGYAQILDFDDNLNPELLHESIEAIQRSGHYLLTLIDDILDIAKIETDQIELYPNEFYLDKFLKKIANFFRQSAEEKGLGFIEQALIKLPTSIYADQKRLRQILANLLSNAVKFTQQGSITFKVELLESKERKTEKKASPQEEQQIEENVAKEQLSKSHLSLPVTHYSIRFQVEDTGIGIAPENFAKILLPFEQMSHWKNKSPGAGLGLSLTNQLVEMMGSKLHIESSLDQGSVFWFILKLPIQLESIHSQS
jgi:signal transduction histidine kinase